MARGLTGSRLIELRLTRSRDRRPPLPLLLPALVVAAAAAVPVAYLVVRTAAAPTGVVGLVLRARTLEIVANTVVIAGGVGLLATLVALPIAWLTTRTDLPGRRWWAVLAAAPLAIPSYVTAFGAIAALGPTGFLRTALKEIGLVGLPPIYGLGGAILVLTVAAYPYVLLAARAALQSTDPAVEEAARSLGDRPPAVFWRVILPTIAPGVASGALLATLYAISDFGAVALLGADTLARAIYTQYRAAFDRSLAAVLGLLLVGLAVAVAVGEAAVRRRVRRIVGPPRRPPTLHQLGPWRLVGLGYLGLVLVVALIMPLGTLVHWLFRGLANDEPLRLTTSAALATIGTAAGAAGLAAVLALPVGLLMVRHPGRWADGLGVVLAVVFAVPGVAVALAVVSLAAGMPFIYQTLGLLIVAYAVRFLPEAVGPLRAALVRAGTRPEEAARSLGDGPIGAFRRVTLPLLRPALVAGAALVFLTTAKELPMALILGPIGFETLATRIWGAASEGFYARAAAPALLLVLVSVVGTAFVLRVEGNGRWGTPEDDLAQ